MGECVRQSLDTYSHGAMALIGQLCLWDGIVVDVDNAIEIDYNQLDCSVKFIEIKTPVRTYERRKAY